MEYLMRQYDVLLEALLTHVEIVVLALILSLLLAAVFAVLCTSFPKVEKWLMQVLSVIYSVPSLAMLALLVPVTGLGGVTAVTALVIYNQYLLLRNFLAGLSEVDPAAVEAARGLGMTDMQILRKVRLPLAMKAIFAGVRIAAVSTIGIGTVVACVNAGGLGTILFDGLRTMNTDKIIWGSILSAGLAAAVDFLLTAAENSFTRTK